MPIPANSSIITSFLLAIIISFASWTLHAEDQWSTAEPSHKLVTITGFSRARHTMELSTEVTGKMQQIYADVGDVLPEPGNIACLDKTFINIDIAAAKNDMAQHQVDKLFYKKQVDRYLALVDKNSAAVSQLDDFQRQLGNSKRFERSKKIQLQRLQEKRLRHCIAAPIGWSVIKRYVEPGQWLDIGNKIAKVGDYTRLLVPLALSLHELNTLRDLQDDITVMLPEYNQAVPAVIERISPAFDERSRKIQVDLLIREQLPTYRGGMRVELKLKIPDRGPVFLVAEQTLDKRFEEIWLHRQDGKSLSVKLLSHEKNGKARVLSEQIKAGDRFKILQP